LLCELEPFRAWRRLSGCYQHHHAYAAPDADPRSGGPRSTGREASSQHFSHDQKIEQFRWYFAASLPGDNRGGCMALRSPGTRLEWHRGNQKIKNAPELNQYVHKDYRAGWSL
jgi:hypothetical protein